MSATVPAARRVVVTGIGMVTPLGTGLKQSWQRLIAGETGIDAITDPEILKYNLPVKAAGWVRKGTAEGEFNLADWVPRNLLPTSSPFIQFAMCAATQALADAKWKPETDEERERTGVAIGSGIGAAEDSFEAGDALYHKGYRKTGPYTIPRILVNLAAGTVSIHHGLRGPNHAVSTACTTGAHAIGDAFRFIRNGDADVMLAGGAEAGVSPMSLALFARIKALGTKWNDKPREASRPFDSLRDGFTMGEGGGVLVLEGLEHALARKARIYAEIVGYGLSADAYHITQPHQDGRGAYTCMRNALREANLSPSQVDYVNAHATSTPIGDAVEARAIRALFHGVGLPAVSQRSVVDSDVANRKRPLLVSSTKGATGHMLGAAGAVEAAFTVLALADQTVPPTLNLAEPDPACEGLDLVPCKARRQEVDVAISNSFGFGGTNASLVFRRWKEAATVA